MIPLAKPYIKDEEITAVTNVLKSGVLSLGKKLIEFEESFAKFLGVKYAVAVSSGTTGLHLAMLAAEIKEGDEIITSPFSFVASTNPMLYVGAKPVFVDIDPLTLNIDVDKIEQAITQKTKAILPVHIFGQVCDMDKIMAIAKKHNLKVIEDACESLGAEYKGKKAGSFGNSAVFAFYPNKQMTTGEGGMIVTNDEKTYKLCKSLCNQGRGEDMKWLDYERLGYNYRLDEMSCALGVEQLKRIDFLIKERQKIANLYNEKLKDVKEITLIKTLETSTNTWFVYTILLDKKIDRNKTIELMHKKEIQCKAYFDKSLHLVDFYKRKFGFKEGMYNITEDICKRTLTLPFYIGLTEQDIDKVVNTLKEIIKNN